MYEIIIINNKDLEDPVDLGLCFPRKVSLEKKKVYNVLDGSEVKKFIYALKFNIDIKNNIKKLTIKKI